MSSPITQIDQDSLNNAYQGFAEIQGEIELTGKRLVDIMNRWPAAVEGETGKAITHVLGTTYQHIDDLRNMMQLEIMDPMKTTVSKAVQAAADHASEISRMGANDANDIGSPSVGTGPNVDLTIGSKVDLTSW